MNTLKSIARVLAICSVCCVTSQAEQPKEPNTPDNGKETGVTIEVVKVDVGDSLLALTYRVRNSSDHEVWVCSRLSSKPFEVYLTSDKQELLIRKRLDVPCTKIWHVPPAAATYIRLAPGGATLESLQIDVPVTPIFVYASAGREAVDQIARRMALEVGYYDENLPALVRNIFDVADEFSAQSWYVYPDWLRTYFRGLIVRNALGDFNTLNKDPEADGCVRIEYSGQALTGEKVLRMELIGIAIPYKGSAEYSTPAEPTGGE